MNVTYKIHNVLSKAMMLLIALNNVLNSAVESRFGIVFGEYRYTDFTCASIRSEAYVVTTEHIQN